jgi:putative sugar O-methyltransferase
MKYTLKLIFWVYRYGLFNLFLRVKFSLRTKKNKHKLNSEIVTNTSISDSTLYLDYPSFCATAAVNQKVFNEFRTYKEIIEVLDHVSIEQAVEYINQILKYSNWKHEFTDVLTHVDSLGKPLHYKFKQGIFSPTSVRYLKTYLEIKKIFGSLEDYNVTEIGIGFGGQASIIAMLSKPSSYTFYDLDSALKLSRKFISTLNLNGKFDFQDGRDPKIGIYLPDLIISNYAFSELSKSVQDAYIENIILKSSRGYMVWNSLAQVHLSSYSLADIIRIIPNSQIIPEIPNTAIGNAIIVWGI